LNHSPAGRVINAISIFWYVRADARASFLAADCGVSVSAEILSNTLISLRCVGVSPLGSGGDR
jgi:hypothetical protein